MRDFKDLEIWSESHQVALEIYKVTRSFPPEEKFGLISQMRNSASFIPTNIAEGCGRGSDRELKRFCDVSMGSASELEYQLILMKDLDYLSGEQYFELNEKLIRFKKRLNAFIQYLINKIGGPNS